MRRYAFAAATIACISTAAHAVTHNHLTQGAQLPIGAYGVAAATLAGKIYVIGGQINGGSATDAVQVYDPVAISWSTGVPLPMPIAYATAVTVGNNLYVLAGAGERQLSTATYRLAAGGTAWETLSPPPRTRSSPAAVALGNAIYLIGGNGPSDDFSPVVQIYNIATNKWRMAPSLPLGVQSPSAGTINNVIYTAGGFNRGTSGDLQALKRGATSWTVLAPEPNPADAACAGVTTGRLYNFGGEDSNSTSAATAAAYDPVANSWAALAPMPVAVAKAAGAVYKDRIYCLGGENNGFDEQPLTQIYTP